MRLFVALRPPPEALAHLRSWPGELEGLRRGRSGQEHVTLAFLGEVADADAVTARLQNRLGGLPPVAPRLRLQGAGSFGRVVWLGLDGDVEALRALHATVAAALRDAGRPDDPRPWTPHLTVGSGQLPPALQSYAGPAAPWQDVALVHSTSGPGGVQHAAVRQWTLPVVGSTSGDVPP